MIVMSDRALCLFEYRVVGFLGVSASVARRERRSLGNDQLVLVHAVDAP